MQMKSNFIVGNLFYPFMTEAPDIAGHRRRTSEESTILLDEHTDAG